MIGGQLAGSEAELPRLEWSPSVPRSDAIAVLAGAPDRRRCAAIQAIPSCRSISQYALKVDRLPAISGTGPSAIEKQALRSRARRFLPGASSVLNEVRNSTAFTQSLRRLESGRTVAA